MFHFLKNNPQLDITIRLFDSVAIPSREMKTFDFKTIAKGKTSQIFCFTKGIKRKIPSSLFFAKKFKQYQEKVKISCVYETCFNRFSKRISLNRPLLICNTMTKDVYLEPKNIFRI